MDYRKYEGDSPEKVLSLYESVGWTNYTWRPEMLRQAYAHSLFALAAYEGEALIGSSGGRRRVHSLRAGSAGPPRISAPGNRQRTAAPRSGPIPAGISDGAAY